MKKIIAMLIACLMVVALVPVIAAPAAAAEKVVYVGKDGTGDGSAADKPMGDLVAAFAAIGDEDGTIVFVNMYDHNKLHKIEAHAGHITLTSKYNGTDYNGGIYASKTDHLALGGDTTFENMNIVVVGKTWMVRARFNHVTFGEGMNIQKEGDAAALSGLFVVGADQGAGSTCDHSQDTHITIKSGNFTEVIGGPRANDNGDMTGKVIIEVTGDARIGKLAFATRSLANKVNLNTALVVLDGGVIENWVAAGDKLTTGFLGDVEIVLTKNFDISKSFDVTGSRTSDGAANGPIFNGISGCTAFQDHVTATLFAKTTLLVDPSIKAAVEATDKILTASFTEGIKEYTYTGTIGSGKLEADAPVVTEPVTTEAPVVTTEAPVATDAPVETTAAPAEPEPTPSTGDGSAVLFAISAACLAAAAAMVFLKKRVTE